MHEPTRIVIVVHHHHGDILHVHRHKLSEFHDKRWHFLLPKIDDIEIGRLIYFRRHINSCIFRGLIGGRSAVDIFVNSNVAYRDRQQFAHFGIEETAANANLVNLLQITEKIAIQLPDKNVCDSFGDNHYTV